MCGATGPGRNAAGSCVRCAVSEQVGALPFTLPSYFVADTSLSYHGDRFRVTAGIKNLFNKVYDAGAINANVVSPAEPRSFALSTTFYF